MGEFLLAPTKPFRLPRPTGPLVHPVLYETIYNLKAKDNETPLRAVVKVNMDIKKHIQVYTSGSSIPLTNATVETWDKKFGVDADVFDHVKVVEYGNGDIYSFPLRVVDSTGLVINPVLAVAGEGFENVVAYFPDTQEFKRGFVWYIACLLNTGTHALSVRALGKSGVPDNEGGSIMRLHSLDLVGPEVKPSAYVDINFPEGTRVGSTSLGSTTSAWTMFYSPATKDQLLTEIQLRLDGVNSNYVGASELDIAVSYSKDFEAFLNSSRKISLSAMHAMATFSGGMSKAGNIACCLAPYREPLSHQDPNVLIDQIAKFPETRKYIGTPAEGLHTTWVPDVIDQWYLQDTKGLEESTFNWTDTHKTQSIFFAIDCPASGTLQPASFQIKTWMNIEGENYDPLYSAQSCNNASLLLNAMVDVLGTLQLCSGNPSHVQKVWAGCKALAKNPTVRMMGKAALTAGKVIGPALISALL